MYNHSKENKLRILIDMDNVVAGLLEKWLFVYNSKYADNLTAADISTWQIDNHTTKCSIKQFYELIEPNGFFAELDVLPDAIEVTKRLQDKGHELYFVTATPHNAPTAGYDKYLWCNTYFPHIGMSNVIMSHKKDMIKGDLLLDDGPINLNEFSGIKVAYNYPYNHHVIVDYRVNNWIEFEILINGLNQ